MKWGSKRDQPPAINPGPVDLHARTAAIEIRKDFGKAPRRTFTLRDDWLELRNKPLFEELIQLRAEVLVLRPRVPGE